MMNCSISMLEESALAVLSLILLESHAKLHELDLLPPLITEFTSDLPFLHLLSSTSVG